MSERYEQSIPQEELRQDVEAKSIEPIKYFGFEDFKREVAEEYEKSGKQDGISVWYQKNYKNYKGWPGNPQQRFKDDGWQGFAVLLGKPKPDRIRYGKRPEQNDEPVI